jgi:hypothetical protein
MGTKTEPPCPVALSGMERAKLCLFPESGAHNSGHCWRTCMVVANNVQTQSNGVDGSGQPLVTMGGGALPLPMPTQPETLTATRVATKANRTFFIGVPLSFTPRDSHFVPRCTVGRPAEPNGSSAPETVRQFKGDRVFGDTVTRRAQQNLLSPSGGWWPVCNGFAGDPFPKPTLKQAEIAV